MSSRRDASEANWVPTLVRTPDEWGLSSRHDAAVSADAEVRRARASALEWMVLGAGLAWIVAYTFLRWPAPLHPQFNSNSNIDSAFFAFAGQLVREGHVPYISFWDHKPPLIYLIDALALTVSGGAVWGIWLVTVAALLATLGMTWVTWRPTVGPTAAAIGIAWVAFSISLVTPFNLTEGFVLPVQAAAILLLSRWSPSRGAFVPALIAGVLLGVAFLLRPNLIGTPGAVLTTMVVGLVLTGRARMLAAWFGGAALGLTLAVAPVLLWLGAHGALRPFWDQVFHYNAVYSTASWPSRARAAFDGVAITTIYGTLLLPCIGWLVAAHRLGSRSSGVVAKPALLFGMLWAPIELALAAVPGRTYMHYFAPLLLPLGYLAAIAAAETFGLVNRAMAPPAARWFRREASVVVCAVIALVPLGRMALEVRDSGLRGNRADQVAVTAQYVREHTPPGSPLLVWGHAADVHFFADRPAAGRFVYPLALLTPRYADSALVDSFIREVRDNPPPIIVDATPGASPSEKLVPPLSKWNPKWRYPETGVAWWTMTPALRRFYDLVSAEYVASDTIGPLKWVLYSRRGRDTATR